MKISDIKNTLKLKEWIGDSLSLTLLFAWTLTYPMHGFFLQGVFGENAYELGHFFSASHGLGLIAAGFLSQHIVRSIKIIKLAGVAVFVLTAAWTFLPQVNLIKFGFCSFLGFSSAYLVIAWACRFIDNKAPALTLGVAMSLTNVLLGLVGFTNIPEAAVKTAAALSGLAPLAGAFYIARVKETKGPQIIPKEQKKIKAGFNTFMGVAFLAAIAYFSGGLWYRAVLPHFYSNWPNIIGIDCIIYAFAVLGLAFYARKRSFYWVGTISLSALGIGLATSVIGLERPLVLASTLAFLAAGLGALDLFYWLTLRKLSIFLGTQKSFGFGLGLSLFFITAPGIALDTGVLTNPLASPIAPVIGACLLFLINPLLVLLLHPLSVSLPQYHEEPESFEEPAAQPIYPAFWHSLTNSEKNVYELICKGQTDAEIAADLIISRHTVKFHARNILRKAGVSNRKELLAQLADSRNTK
ncbi:MAG: LuxR C-terminal-related transcriptional regulator [Bacillota bacterium]